MINKTYTLCLLAIFAFIGCKKKETRDNTDVTFVNHINKQVVLTIYPTFDNYALATNPTIRKVINASDKLILPGSTFTSGQTYYMDWHTDDFFYNNWYNDKYPQSGAQVAFKPVVGSNTYYLDDHFSGYSRTVFLATNDQISKWHAVNAYLYSNSTGYVSQWSTFAEYEKYRIVTVNKNFTAQYEYKTSPTVNATNNYDIKVMASTNAYILFMGSNGADSGSMVMGKLPTAAPPDYNTNTKDTIMALLPNSDYYFMMVKD
jgi:hypothetical protein